MLEPGTTQTISAQDRLLDLYDRMIGDSGLSEALSNVAMVIHDILECERATVYIRSTETDELESVATIGNVSTRIKVPISSRSLAGHCAVTQRAFFIPDAYGDLSAVSPELRFDGAWDKLNSFRTRDVICAPAMFRGELFGVIQAINSEGTPFSEKSLRPMKTIARLVAYALYHAKVYDDLASMKQLEREKAKFMQIMVHELKSPIAASKMMVDVMRGFQDLGKDAMRLADRIAARLDQVLEMTRDVLSLADVKSGNPLGNISTFDIVPETRNICNSYLDHAGAKGIEIAVDLPDQPVLARFDITGFKLTISNLVSNAVKYTPEGRVTVTLDPGTEFALVSVRDTGMGIPSEDIPKLFTPFHRASNARRSTVFGTGVGLAGVRDIVERFGGAIELESELNVGSVFRVRIPVATE